MLIILRQSREHANFGAFWGRRCSTPLIEELNFNEVYEPAKLQVLWYSQKLFEESK